MSEYYEVLKYWIKNFLLHLLIATSYLSISCYKFIHDKYPDPIGVGIMQWLFFLAHILAILFFFLLKKGNRQNLVSNLLAVVIVFIIYLLFNNLIWEQLWELRGDAIQ